MTNSVLIVAAGTGNRSGLTIPKQYSLFGGKSLLSHTLTPFIESNLFDQIGIVIHPDHQEMYNLSLSETQRSFCLSPIFGGETRQNSVFKGLQALEKYNPKTVFIHDAARPFLSISMLQALCKKLDLYEGCAPILDSVDSLCIKEKETLVGSLDRSTIVRMQTPQAFKYKKILWAHASSQKDSFSDDISLALKAGLHVGYIHGTPQNKKMTFPDDFMHTIPDFRTASGYDVHRLIQGEGVILGGVTLPCPFSLQGHSDADVLLHSLTDAILGTMALEDIGHHFPPSDPQWKGVASTHFLEYALQKLKEKKGTLHFIDITIICEVPKISPVREKIRHSLATLCSLSLSKISVKATTTEKLGFTGRKEGMAVQALATSFF